MLFRSLYVTELEKAKEFFETYFYARSNDGYHNKTTDFRSYFLTFQDGARLEIMKKPNLKNQQDTSNSIGYAHIAFSVGSKEEVDALTLKLKNDGYIVQNGPRTTGDGYYESCIIDLEGNLIEITI